MKKRVIKIRLSPAQYQTLLEKGEPEEVATEILLKIIRDIELSKTEPFLK